MTDHKQPQRTATGVSGLDDILHGGLPSGQMYLLEGDPGTGKTTAALQFILEGGRRGERTLYVTLSESKAELEAAAASHGWSLDSVEIVEFVPEEATLSAEDSYTVFHPNEVELASTIKKLIEEIERVKAQRVVLDSLSELRLLAAEPVKYRRQLLALKRYFAGRGMTTLLLDDRSSEGSDVQLQSIAHGVIRLQKNPRSYGITRRQVEVLKVRGSSFREGLHDYCISADGLEVFPRLVAAEHPFNFREDVLPAGVPALDLMFGGGLDRGSSTLVTGPTGVGKSSVVMQYLVAAASRGERVVLYTFDESIRSACVRGNTLGLGVTEQMDLGHLSLKQIDPAELSPGEFVSQICHAVEKEGARVVAIDSLNGFLHAMTGESDLPLQLHELLTYLGARGVATFLVMTQHGFLGETRTQADVSYLADNVLLMRYFENRGTVRRAFSVMKKRSGPHETSIRELSLSVDGIRVGEPLVEFRGIMSGSPEIDLSAGDETAISGPAQGIRK
jgi:circadian clock protein KaiC